MYFQPNENRERELLAHQRSPEQRHSAYLQQQKLRQSVQNQLSVKKILTFDCITSKQCINGRRFKWTTKFINTCKISLWAYNLEPVVIDWGALSRTVVIGLTLSWGLTLRMHAFVVQMKQNSVSSKFSVVHLKRRTVDRRPCIPN